MNGNRLVGSTKLKLRDYGFGCASLGNLFHAISDSESADIMRAAWESGFRYFDTAPFYGQGLSERRVGDGLRFLKGRDYILSTKVGKLLRPSGYADSRHSFISPMPFDITLDYSYDGVMRSFEDSLNRLGLDRIDILYMHDIGRTDLGNAYDEIFPVAMKSGYKALDELRQQGLVKAIGLGVNECQVCEDAMDYGEWDCFLLAGRYTLLEQESLNTFFPKCEQHNCSVIIGGAYNSGILATGTRGSVKPIYNYQEAPDHVIQKVRKIELLCDEFKVPLAAAALQFPLAHASVASVIPGVGKLTQVKQTADLTCVGIPAEFWQELKRQELVHEAAPVPVGGQDAN